MNFTAAERRLLADLLVMGGEAYANRICNDFDLSASIPDGDERDRIVRAYHEWNGDPEEYWDDVDDGRGDYRMMDFMLFAYFAAKVRGEIA